MYRRSLEKSLQISQAKHQKQIKSIKHKKKLQKMRKGFKDPKRSIIPRDKAIILGRIMQIVFCFKYCEYLNDSKNYLTTKQETWE